MSQDGALRAPFAPLDKSVASSRPASGPWQFSSDPRLEGVPFAAFSAILIEQIALVPFD
jgi:hypothetical protein